MSELHEIHEIRGPYDERTDVIGMDTLRQSYAAAMYGEDSRGRLLRATALVVARQGVHNCTVQDILDQAEISRRTFYKTFSNMEEALDALFEVATGLVRSEIERAIVDAKTPAEVARSAVDAYLNLQLVGGRLIIVLQDESRKHDSLLAPRRDELIDQFSYLLRDTLEAEGGGRHDILVYRSTILMLEGLVHHVQRTGRLDQVKAQRIRDVTLAFLFRTLGTGDLREFPVPSEIVD